MELMKDSIAAGQAARLPSVPPGGVRARDIMTHRVLTLREDQPLVTAVIKLVASKISGAPVIDDNGHLVGILSEFDCMKQLANGSFHQEGLPQDATVGDVMTMAAHRVQPDTDLFSIASLFIAHRIRRLPVVEKQRVVGIVSRRDALRAISELYK